MQRYEPSRYWSELFANGVDARTVGYADLPLSFNRLGHEAGRRAVRRAMQKTRAEPRGARILDVGSGGGLWVDFWRSLGAAEVVALDLTTEATQRLRAHVPGMRVEQADISVELPADLGEFDLVSAMNVLLHVTSNEKFDRAIANLARTLAPRGRIVFVDPIVVHGWFGPPLGDSATSHIRSLAEWRETLNRHDLRIVDVSATTCLLASAVDTRSRTTLQLLWFYWNAVSKLVRGHERLALGVGRALAALDALSLRLVQTGPSGKVLVAERRHP